VSVHGRHATAVLREICELGSTPALEFDEEFDEE
jgi:hypothetical protein